MNIFPSNDKNKRRTRNGRGASVRVTDKKVEKTIKFPKKTFFCLMAIGCGYLLAINFHKLYENLNTQRIEYVIIDGNLNYVTEDEVKSAVFGFVDQSLVIIKLEEIKKVLETNPWIKSVEIQREWPSTLIIGVEEELAIARWGEKQLLNAESEIFSPTTMLNQTHLPYLSGPKGLEQTVMNQYQQFNLLLYPQGLKIADLELNNRGAWTLVLASGTKISVGSQLMMERMARFVTCLESMFIKDFENISSVDLRYKNGIAVNRHKKVVSI